MKTLLGWTNPILFDGCGGVVLDNASLGEVWPPSLPSSGTSPLPGLHTLTGSSSPQFSDLAFRCLRVDPAERISAPMALKQRLFFFLFFCPPPLGHALCMSNFSIPNCVWLVGMLTVTLRFPVAGWIQNRQPSLLPVAFGVPRPR